MISWRSITGFVTRRGEDLWQVIAIVLGTPLSFLIALWLNLAEPFWSVITAAILVGNYSRHRGAVHSKRCPAPRDISIAWHFNRRIHWLSGGLWTWTNSKGRVVVFSCSYTWVGRRGAS
jgi:hypothetical protein